MTKLKYYTHNAGFERRLKFVNSVLDDVEILLRKGGTPREYKRKALARVAGALCSDEMAYLTMFDVDTELLQMKIAEARKATEPTSKTTADIMRAVKALKYETVTKKKRPSYERN